MKIQLIAPFINRNLIHRFHWYIRTLFVPVFFILFRFLHASGECVSRHSIDLALLLLSPNCHIHWIVQLWWHICEQFDRQKQNKKMLIKFRIIFIYPYECDIRARLTTDTFQIFECTHFEERTSLCIEDRLSCIHTHATHIVLKYQQLKVLTCMNCQNANGHKYIYLSIRI